MTNPPTDTERLSVLDATHEVAAAQPRKALIGVDVREWRRVRKSLDDTRTYPWDSVQR